MSLKLLTPAQATAYKRLNINTYDTPDGISGDRIILSLDGGGIRGILTLQLLKKMEEIAGMPCYEFCDMVAGTSTGAIIAGLMVGGNSAAQIEKMYVSFVTRVFTRRNIISDCVIDPPHYDKAQYRSDLKQELQDRTLQDACSSSGMDLLISAKDMTVNQETFFTCFNHPEGCKGTYKDALLRIVMEATMSAPTYFKALGRYLDGGTTVYNNPSVAAYMEATEYDGKEKYHADKITVFSLGTGRYSQCISPEDAAHPKGIDILFWFKYMIKTSIQDANAMQSDLFRSKVFSHVDYRRFQVSLDARTMQLLPDRDIMVRHLGMTVKQRLHGLTDDHLNGIELDDVEKFDLMKDIGGAFVDYIMIKNKFTADLNDTPSGKDELVTKVDDIADTLKELTNIAWLESQTTGSMAKCANFITFKPMNRAQLKDIIFKKRSVLCVGLDTDLTKIPKHLLGEEDPAFAFNKAIIDATKDFTVAYKINTAFYEAQGIKGWETMQKTLAHIPKDIFTIADAKRGDIGNTSEQYARTFFHTYPFDSVTIAPYMGADSVKPFLQFEGKWSIVLGLTSNAGSADFQLQQCGDELLYQKVLRTVASWGTPDNIMFVIGATRKEQLQEVRALLPDHFFLVPGVGAQGGDVDTVCRAAFNKDAGLLINVSRGVIYASNDESFVDKAYEEAKKYQQEMSVFF